MDKIEAIIMSIDYSDYLDISLKYNLNYFDNIIIVTNNADTKTHNIAEKYGCDLIKTEVFYENNSVLNRGKALNIAFEQLKYKNWVALLDADIILPKNFKNNFLETNPNIEMYYWMKRFEIKNQKEWDDYFINGKYNIIKEQGAIGYLQLFNYNSNVFQNSLKINNKKPYPETSIDVSKADIEFRDQWSLNLLHEISNYICLHLGEPGINWQGRVTEEIKIS